jgi:glucose/arabinose dehydrogenase
MCRAAVAFLILCLGPTAALALDLRSGVPEGGIEVNLNVLVSTPLDAATEFAFIDLVPFNDGTGRLAVSTIQGGVRVVEADGDLSPTHLLTKAQTQLVLPQEAGLTGIAFHPDFNNAGTFGYGKFYTITTEAPENEGGLGDADVDFPYPLGPQVEEHQDVVREWNLSAFGNVPGNAANNAFTGTLANSRELLRVDQPGPFHNVVDLAFNTNAEPMDADYGLLYITSGDGGNPLGMNGSEANMQRANSAQNLSTIYGNVLRIDPDPTAHALVRTSANSGQPAYSIPDDNPYNGDDGVETTTASTLAEIWAHGFRSPWRITFDRETGDLYLGDVGENAWEEVDIVEEGLNYGWGHVEGTHDGTLLPGDGTLVPGLTPPIIELSHTNASRSINGGFVYRGSAIPELYGKYVFADLGQGFNSSAIFYAIVDPADPDGNVGDVFEFKLNAMAPKFEDNTQELPERIFSIGEDLDGEIYLVGGPDPRQPFNPNRPSVIIRLEASFPFLFGDLNSDLLISPVDWNLFKAGQGTDFSGMTAQQSYYFGDLDADFDHDLSDFLLFRTAYEDFNGTGSFAAMLSAPEPSSFALLIMSLCFTVGAIRKNRLSKWRA